jgi:hypothetical protein
MYSVEHASPLDQFMPSTESEPTLKLICAESMGAVRA